MPCQFSLGYASSFEPSTTLDPNSENSFGNGCQFKFVQEGALTSLDGKMWCPFHLPLTDAEGRDSPKKAWNFMTQARMGWLLSQFIKEKREQGKPIDLCGLVHWDRLTFGMEYQEDLSGAQKVCYESLPPVALDGAYFPRGVDFNGVKFAKPAYFRNVFFGSQADFVKVKFLDQADFSGSLFKADANFYGASFEKNASFSGARFCQKMMFSTAEFFEMADFSLSNDCNYFFSERSETESIRGAYFHAARFNGASRFNDRQFLAGPKFDRALFAIAPEFHNATFHQSADFDGAKFTDTSLASADHSYRTLKLIMEGLGARDEQAWFFALEQQARSNKKFTPFSVRLFSKIYGLLSGYGQTFVRPLFVLALVTVIFGGAYMLMLESINGRPPSFGFIVNFTMDQMIRPFGVWVPDYLVKAGVSVSPHTELTASELLLKAISTMQALVSLGLVALALLALRRRFKLD